MHFGPGTPHGRQFVHYLIVNCGGLEEDLVGIFEVVAFFVELCKAYPEFAHLAVSILRIDLKNSFSICFQGEELIEFAEFSKIEPFVNIVRILTEDDVTEKEGTSFKEVFDAIHDEVRIGFDGVEIFRLAVGHFLVVYAIHGDVD